MTKKFRRSIWGFNREDVLAFAARSTENETKLKADIDELKSKMSELKSTLDEMTLLQEQTAAVLSETEKQLDSYKQREDSITALGESIGRLYLVAKSNAESIVNEAQRSAEVSREVVTKNLETADTAEKELEDIGRILDEKTRIYLSEIEELKVALDSAKRAVAENSVSIDEHIAEAEAVLAENR